MIFSIIILFFEHLNAQKYDIFIHELLKQNNWFALEKEYPQIQDSIKTPELKWLTESLLNIKFNQNEAAISSIDTLLHKYQQNIGFTNSVELFRYKISLLAYQGEYGFIAGELKNFIDQVSENLPQEELKKFEEMYNFYNSLRNEEKTQVIKPEKNIEIPFGTIEMDFTSRKDEDTIHDMTSALGVVKIFIQGKEYIFILDTGYETTCIFNNTSKNINLHYLNDSINISGTGISQGNLAILDNISLGEVTLYNLLIVVSDNFLEKSGIFRNENINDYIDGVLGIDFIKRIGEIQLYPSDKKIIIPQKESELPISGRNIILDERNNIIVKAFSEDDLITFHLDTGNSNSHMFKSYYLKNRNEIETTLEKKLTYSFGVGAIKSDTIYQMPSLALLIGETFFSLKNIPIYTVDYFMEDPSADGSLGTDFINKFSKITLNLNKMFIQLKK